MDPSTKPSSDVDMQLRHVTVTSEKSKGNQYSPFMRLPLELQHRIFEQILVSCRPIHVEVPSLQRRDLKFTVCADHPFPCRCVYFSSSNSRETVDLALFGVSHHIRHVASFVFFSHNWFTFPCNSTLEAFQNKFKNSTRCIKKMCLVIRANEEILSTSSFWGPSPRDLAAQRRRLVNLSFLHITLKAETGRHVNVYEDGILSHAIPFSRPKVDHFTCDVNLSGGHSSNEVVSIEKLQQRLVKLFAEETQEPFEPSQPPPKIVKVKSNAEKRAECKGVLALEEV